jgi:hypothetical protein
MGKVECSRPFSSLVSRFAEKMRNDPELRNERERLAKIV